MTLFDPDLLSAVDRVSKQYIAVHDELERILPWNWTIMPVASMLFYQFFPKINPWVKGAVFGAFAAYVVEPVFIRLKFYEPSGWEHHYSLPLYFGI